jgi:amidase
MDLYRLGITEALAAIASGQCTRSAYLESCIARTLAVEPAIAAFAHFDPEAVRSAAVHDAGILAGMPIGIKDIIRTRGVPTEMGSAAFRGHVPDVSATVIDALTEAGAVVFGKTVTTEFAWRNPGPTRNPWNTAHTPGGSSSGSAAAVAAGCVPGALGTQTLGSVLRPAAFCGVVGYKPSYGAISRTGVYPLAASLDHIGVFTRGVADAALLASALFGHDAIDVPHVTQLPALRPLQPLRAPRIALLHTSIWDRVSPDQQALVDATAALLAEHGAVVTPLALPAAFDVLWSTAQTLCDVEGAAVNADLAAETPPRVSQATIDLVTRGSAVTALDYVRARETQRSLIEAFAAIMAPFDAALMAPALGVAPVGLDDTGDAVLCTPGSLLGGPAITMPCGVGEDRLPLGIQLLGRWGDDQRLLETAAWVEHAIGWSRDFPAVSTG